MRVRSLPAYLMSVMATSTSTLATAGGNDTLVMGTRWLWEPVGVRWKVRGDAGVKGVMDVWIICVKHLPSAQSYFARLFRHCPPLPQACPGNSRLTLMQQRQQPQQWRAPLCLAPGLLSEHKVVLWPLICIPPLPSPRLLARQRRSPLLPPPDLPPPMVQPAQPRHPSRLFSPVSAANAYCGQPHQLVWKHHLQHALPAQSSSSSSRHSAVDAGVLPQPMSLS